MKFKLDTIFKDNHGCLYMITKLPTERLHGRSMKIVDPYYTLTRVPDKITFKSKHDGEYVNYVYPETTIVEEQIEINVRKGNWTQI